MIYNIQFNDDNVNCYNKYYITENEGWVFVLIPNQDHHHMFKCSPSQEQFILIICSCYIIGKER